MNKYSIKILKYLNKHSSKDKPIKLEKLYQVFSFDEQTIKNSVEILEKNKLINYMNYGEYCDDIIFCVKYFYSNTAGKDYFKDIYLNNIKSFLLKCSELLFDRIILTIVVSIITSILTTIITLKIFS